MMKLNTFFIFSLFVALGLLSNLFAQVPLRPVEAGQNGKGVQQPKQGGLDRDDLAEATDVDLEHVDVFALERLLDIIAKEKQQLRTELENDAEVQEKRKELTQAMFNYNDFVDGYRPVLAARKETEKKRKALWERTVEKSHDRPDLVELMGQLEITEGKRRMARWHMALARMELDHIDSPINQALDEDPRLIALEEGKEPPVDDEAVKAWMMNQSVDEVRAEIKRQMPQVIALEAEIEKNERIANEESTRHSLVRTELWKQREAMFMGGDEELTEMKRDLDRSVNIFRESFALPQVEALNRVKLAKKRELDDLIEQKLALDSRGEALLTEEENVRSLHRKKLQMLVAEQMGQLKK